MRIINRIDLVKILENWENSHCHLFTMLATRNTRARHNFNRMYFAKPISDWTDLDKQNTLGYMLGYNVIKG